MPQKFAFEQGLRDRGTVNGHERLIGPGTAVMDGPRHQFFAGAAFALDKNRRGIAAGDLLHHFQDLVHFAAAGNDARLTVALGLLAAEAGQLFAEAAVFQGAMYHNRQFLGGGRFAQIIAGAVEQRGHGMFRKLSGGSDDHRTGFAEITDLLVDVPSVHIGELQIENQQVRGAIGQQLQGRVAASAPPDPMPLLTEHLFQRLTEGLIGVYNQNIGRMFHRISPSVIG